MNAPVKLEIYIDPHLRDDLAKRLIAHAERLKGPPIDLLTDLVRIILTDNLVDAVLDEGGPK